MGELRFDWDKTKEASNLRKHGVSFREAETVFYDESARIVEDPAHSASEERFILLGLSFAIRILAVHHTYRAGGGIIRLISARKATRAERAEYRNLRRP